MLDNPRGPNFTNTSLPFLFRTPTGGFGVLQAECSEDMTARIVPGQVWILTVVFFPPLFIWKVKHRKFSSWTDYEKRTAIPRGRTGNVDEPPGHSQCVPSWCRLRSSVELWNGGNFKAEKLNEGRGRRRRTPSRKSVVRTAISFALSPLLRLGAWGSNYTNTFNLYICLFTGIIFWIIVKR